MPVWPFVVAFECILSPKKVFFCVFLSYFIFVVYIPVSAFWPLSRNDENGKFRPTTFKRCVRECMAGMGGVRAGAGTALESLTRTPATTLECFLVTPLNISGRT